MPTPLLTIVSGPPGTGKTTLAQRVAAEFSLPCFNKDGIKELLFDTLGWSDREWSKRLGSATYAVLWDIVERRLAARASFVVESNFHVSLHSERFNDLRGKYPFVPFQINCTADGDVLYERFKERAESGARHPGHTDVMNIDEFEETLRRGRHDPLAIGGDVYAVDMTDFTKIDYAALFAAVRAQLAQAGSRSPVAGGDRIHRLPATGDTIGLRSQCADG